MRLELNHYETKTITSGSIMEGNLFVTSFFVRVETDGNYFYPSLQRSGTEPKAIFPNFKAVGRYSGFDSKELALEAVNAEFEAIKKRFN